MAETVKVLVVDDDRRMVKTIRDILKVKGFDAASAYTGEEAVAKVRTRRTDCVLMDIRMPGIDGVEALRMMKQLIPDLPVVLMSAYATEKQVREAKFQGAYAVLTKPIDMQQVLSFLSLFWREKSILVVDKDPLFCDTLQDFLCSRNYRVESEDDPKKVLIRMEQKYELAVLLELKPGNGDGLELLRDIRLRYPTKPVILVSGYREEMNSAMEKGVRNGAYTCLYKPLGAEELIGVIDEIRQKKLSTVLGEPFRA